MNALGFKKFIITLLIVAMTVTNSGFVALAQNTDVDIDNDIQLEEEGFNVSEALLADDDSSKDSDVDKKKYEDEKENDAEQDTDVDQEKDTDQKNDADQNIDDNHGQATSSIIIIDDDDIQDSNLKISTDSDLDPTTKQEIFREPMQIDEDGDIEQDDLSTFGSILDIDDANKYLLDVFIPKMNKKFSYDVDENKNQMRKNIYTDEDRI